MMERFPSFDRSRLRSLPLAAREHLLQLTDILELHPRPWRGSNLGAVAKRILQAREKQSAVIMMMGAHVIRSGVQRYVLDMMERGLLTCIAMNGAGVIHDFEFALVGATTENVAHYIRDGRFGLWEETGRINDIVSDAAAKKLGLGEAVGLVIEEEAFPHRDISLLAAAYRLGIPVTVHVGIGYDIVHEHPNCDGAAYGATSYLDFLRFTHALSSLEGGVIMNFGSSVMGPEVYLKALAMVRNVAAQDGQEVAHFTTVVCDLVDIGGEGRREPPHDDPMYYFRPLKTMLVRTVADGGESFYIKGQHRETVPQLWTALNREE
jgi:hypothetical protein